MKTLREQIIDLLEDAIPCSAVCHCEAEIEIEVDLEGLADEILELTKERIK